MPSCSNTLAKAFAATLLAATCALAGSGAHALVIETHFALPGERSLIGGRFEATPTSRIVGGGDFEAVFNAAARLWEAALDDDRRIRINVGWSGRIGRAVAAATAGNDVFGNEIVFSTRETHFADSTPTQNEEFGAFAEAVTDFGGGAIVSSRGFGESLLALGGQDLLTTALHEIGHVLGNPFDSFRGTQLDISDGPFAGTALPCVNDSGATCGHLNLGGAVLNPFAGSERFVRTLIGGADLLFVATDGGFHSFDIDLVRPSAVPEPATVLLVAFGLFAIGGLRRRHAAARLA